MLVLFRAHKSMLWPFSLFNSVANNFFLKKKNPADKLELIPIRYARGTQGKGSHGLETSLGLLADELGTFG